MKPRVSQTQSKHFVGVCFRNVLHLFDKQQDICEQILIKQEFASVENFQIIPTSNSSHNLVYLIDVFAIACQNIF